MPKPDPAGALFPWEIGTTELLQDRITIPELQYGNTH